MHARFHGDGQEGKGSLETRQLLQIQQTSPINVGNYVWLSPAALKLYHNSKSDQAPVEEGPFKVVHHDN